MSDNETKANAPQDAQESASQESPKYSAEQLKAIASTTPFPTLLAESECPNSAARNRANDNLKLVWRNQYVVSIAKSIKPDASDKTVSETISAAWAESLVIWKAQFPSNRQPSATTETLRQMAAAQKAAEERQAALAAEQAAALKALQDAQAAQMALMQQWMQMQMQMQAAPQAASQAAPATDTASSDADITSAS